MFARSLSVLFVLLSSAAFVSGYDSPAAVYCSRLGYTLSVVEESAGQREVCILPNGKSCDSWEFMAGKCGLEYSYCAVKGYEWKRVENDRKCMTASSNECLLCVMPDGSEREVVDLVKNEPQLGGVYVEEKSYEYECGDGFCDHIGENIESCPQDCLVRDQTLPVLLALALIVLLVAYVYFFRLRRRRR